MSIFTRSRRSLHPLLRPAAAAIDSSAFSGVVVAVGHPLQWKHGFVHRKQYLHKQLQQQQRDISTTYLFDFILQRPNPLLVSVQNMLNSKNSTGTTNVQTFQSPAVGEHGEDQQEYSVNMGRIPHLSGIEPFHVKAASKHVLETYQQELETLKRKYSNGDAAGNDNANKDGSANHFWNDWNRINEPIFALDRTISLLSQVCENSKKRPWELARSNFTEQRRQVEKPHAALLYALVQQLSSSKSLQQQESTPSSASAALETPYAIMTTTEKEWAGHCLRLYLEDVFAAHLENNNFNDDDDDDDDDRREKYQYLSNRLETTKMEFVNDCAKSKITNDTVGLMYNLIGLSCDKAKLLGYPDFCSYIMQQHRRMANRDEVDQLFATVSEHCIAFLKKVDQIVDVDEENKFTALEAYLKTSDGKPSKQKVRPKSMAHVEDERNMMFLEHHVTLDGAMSLLSQLLKTAFGVEIIRDEKSHVPSWSNEVHLYHVFDSNSLNKKQQHLGSFFLDPFERNGKVTRPCVVSLSSRGCGRDHNGSGEDRGDDGDNDGPIPIVAMLLQIEPPVWDSDPAKMTWLDMKHLFHEMGHVLQEMLAQSPHGVLLGPQYMPRDASEILPYLMEHWLLERTTLYGLIAASNLNMEFTEDSINALYRVIARQKALELMQQIYLGTLEFTLLSGFDLRGKETIMALQRRLSKKLLAPTQQDLAPASPDDLTPLVQVLLCNFTDDPIGFYSYVWADAVAATIFAQLKQAYTTKATTTQKAPSASFDDDDTDSSDGSNSSSNNVHNMADSQESALAMDKIRRLLLFPGAVVPADAVRSEWGLGNSVSPAPLLERYGFRNNSRKKPENM
ncbi:hypothetical protein ACA910_006222 [Epithemia clementina (nom. ined.)]